MKFSTLNIAGLAVLFQIRSKSLNSSYSNTRHDFSCPESIMTVITAGNEIHRLRGHEMIYNVYKEPCMETGTN